MKVSEQAAGKRVDCPACKKAFLAPKALATPPKPVGGPPPATTPNRVWYVHVDGRNDGPHTADTVVEQAKTGRLDAHTLAWREGMKDWQPLGEMPEFQGAFSAPPPVSKPQAHKPRAKGDEQEPHAHYRPGRARRDTMIGFWVAGGLGLAILVAILIVANRRDELPPPRRPVVVQQPLPPEPAPPATSTTPGVKVIHGPRPLEPTKTPVKAELSNAKLMANLVADLDKGFKDAIVGHTKAMAKPIFALIAKCRSHAEKLAARDWGPYKGEMETLIRRLNEAASGLDTTLKERAVAWGLGDGLDEKKRAEILELDQYDWLTRWQKILADEVEKVRKKGLDF